MQGWDEGWVGDVVPLVFVCWLEVCVGEGVILEYLKCHNFALFLACVLFKEHEIRVFATIFLTV